MANELTQRLKAVVEEAVVPLLDAAGFRRQRPWIWERAQDEVVIVLEVRRRARHDELHFTLDWGVWVPGYDELAMGFPGPVPTVAGSVVLGFVGRIVAGHAAWWTVLADGWGHAYSDDDQMSREEIVAELAALVGGPFLAAADAIHTIEDVVGLCRSGQFSLSPAAIRHGTAVENLSALARGETVPSREPAPGEVGGDAAWLTVEVPDDPEWGEDVAVQYSDVALAEEPELVRESLKMIRAFPGVTKAWFEDDDLIEVAGPVDMQALEAALRRWWGERSPNAQP